MRPAKGMAPARGATTILRKRARCRSRCPVRLYEAWHPQGVPLLYYGSALGAGLAAPSGSARHGTRKGCHYYTTEARSVQVSLPRRVALRKTSFAITPPSPARSSSLQRG